MGDPITQPPAAEHPDDAVRHARHGLILFAIYLVLYGGFVGLNAFWPQVMGMRTFIGGANLALVYGVGLIVAALVLALIYMFLCRASTDHPRA